jgi:hypothetical protein
MQTNKRGGQRIIGRLLHQKVPRAEASIRYREHHSPSTRFVETYHRAKRRGGAFYDGLPPHSRRGYDVAPRCPGLAMADFLNVVDECFTESPQDTLVVGNPPFGKNGCMAMRFLNACLLRANCVAFILPRSFEKESFLRRVHPLTAHIIHQEVLPLDSFERLGVSKSIPTVFMIWKRCDDLPPRHYDFVEQPDDFEFVTAPSEPEIASGEIFMIQRVGVKAGRITRSVEDMRSKRTSKNFYFVRSRRGSTVWNRFCEMNLANREAKHKTAGMPSIAKSEIILEYQKVVNQNK